MKNINIFCYGFGQVAKSFVNRLSLEGFKVQLSTTNRSETTFNKIGSIEYKSYKFENNNFDEEIFDKLKNSDHILISIPPIDGNDIVINNFSDSLKISNIKWTNPIIINRCPCVHHNFLSMNQTINMIP